MGFYKRFWLGYFDFTGRTSRRDFWLTFLVTLLIGITATLYDYFSELPLAIYQIYVAFSVAVFIPLISITVRRLHDIDRRGLWILIWLVPFVGQIVTLVFLVRKGDEGDNRYGPSPLAKEASINGAGSAPDEPVASSDLESRSSVLPAAWKKSWKTAAFCLLLLSVFVIYPTYFSAHLPKFSDDWTLLDVSAKGEDSSSIYVKTLSTDPDENIVNVWVLNDYPEAKTEENFGKKYYSSFSLEHYDCANAQSGRTQILYHTKNLGGGRIIVTHSEFLKMTPIYQKSVAEQVLRLVCAHREIPSLEPQPSPANTEKT